MLPVVCPNSRCQRKASCVVTHGYGEPVAALNGARRRRYRCQHCGKTFSANVHALDFRCKNKDQALSAKIFWAFVQGSSNRGIADQHAVSEHCVRIRLRKMSAWAFDFHAHKLKGLKISEAICMDGLENFAGSQYDPNYINQALGQDSLFIYDFNFTALNRKGRMSPWQKARLKEIEETVGRYPPSALRADTARLLARLHAKTAGKLCVLSDEHFQYKWAIRVELKDLNIEHVTVSGKACRNFQNIIFPVNHADLLIRHRIAAFKRETIAFAKTPARMCQKFMLFALHKNYMREQFSKVHIRRPLAHRQTPAQHLGLTSQKLKFSQIFSPQQRVENKHAALAHADWAHFKADSIPEAGQRSKRFCKQPKTVPHVA